MVVPAAAVLELEAGGGVVVPTAAVQEGGSLEVSLTALVLFHITAEDFHSETILCTWAAHVRAATLGAVLGAVTIECAGGSRWSRARTIYIKGDSLSLVHAWSKPCTIRTLGTLRGGARITHTRTQTAAATATTKATAPQPQQQPPPPQQEKPQSRGSNV